MSEEIKNEDLVEDLAEAAKPAEETVADVETPVAPVVEEPAAVVEEAPAAKIAEEPKDVISSGSQQGTPSEDVAGITAVENGVIGTGRVARKPKPEAAAAPAEAEKVAIHSTKNVTWSGVGKVYRGYNIVTKEAAEKWLTRNHTRPATPEEVAKEFGQ